MSLLEAKEVTMKHKKRTERVYNEATGWYETREVELKGYTFTDDDRILIIREYLESGVPAEEIRNFHDISCSFLSGVNHFINFFYQPIVPLGMEHIIEFTEMFCYAILRKQIHNVFCGHIFGFCILFYAERYKLSPFFYFAFHCAHPFCGYATHYSFLFGIYGLCH